MRRRPARRSAGATPAARPTGSRCGGPTPARPPAENLPMSPEPVVALVAVTEKDGRRDFAVHPAVGTDGRSADRAAENAGSGADVERPFQSGAVADLGAGLQDHGALAHVEHYSRLHQRLA